MFSTKRHTLCAGSVFVALTLATPSLYPSESAHTLQVQAKQTIEQLTDLFKTVEVPGTLENETGMLTIFSTHSACSNSVVIRNDQDTTVLELSNYLHTVIAAHREADCWILGNDDKTITYIPHSPITCATLEKLDKEQLALITDFAQRSTKTERSTRLDKEEQRKVYATLPAWFQRVLRIRYAVIDDSMLH